MKLSRYKIILGSFSLGLTLFFAPSKSDAQAQEANAEESPAEEKKAHAPKVLPDPTPKTTPEAAPKTTPDPATQPAVESDADRLRKEVAELTLERDLLTTRAAIAKEKFTADLRVRREMLEREKLEMDERSQRLAREVLDRREKLERGLEKLREQTDRLKIEKEAATAKVDLSLQKLRLGETELKGQLNLLTLTAATKAKTMEARLFSQREPVYLDNPLKGKTLIISDRRIPLNGPITARTATEISTRIQYYNNKDSKKPIFIVIDDSPGGSVMAGYHILKAMDGSDAPVYVVLKKFAASMAACITTLADRSFAYPNAIMLHHQISSGVRGNLTQQRESLEATEEWWRRLADPVAKKMGISSEEFIKQMYDKVSTGDWMEFADQAQRLKWLDVVVEEIRETGQEKHPDARKPSPVKTKLTPPTRSFEFAPSERTDEKGRPYMRLPRPNPIDKYYLYNPDGYYRFP